jgi:chemotaxis protein CheD
MAGELLIGIAEMVISKDPHSVLAAPNLGSCLGVSAYDQRTKIGGMIHCLLPMSKSDPAKAAEKPTMYVDTGVALMLSKLVAQGCQIKDLEINVAGGAQINDQNNFFEIGKKNYTILRKLLWKNNLLIKGEHVGGVISRTISLRISSGEVWLRVNGEHFQLNK